MTTLLNFGGNLRLRPRAIAVPHCEADVLKILAEYRGKRIRAVGRLHSWSEAAVAEEVLVDLRYLNGVQTESVGDELHATIGAGCQIKRALAELERRAGLTLPSVGLITEQTIAGAAATGTHGSGKHSVSHYLDEVRVATYDAQTGQPTIRVICDGPQLRAARCSLGCLGIVLSVTLRCRPQYRVEEFVRRYPSLDEVLAAEDEWPLQQFFLIPWLWQFYAQHRREVTSRRSWPAWLYRIYWFMGMDVGVHLAIRLLARTLRSATAVRLFFARLLPLFVIQGWHVTDTSHKMLTMRHDLFRHIEIEVFVTRSKLAETVVYVEELIRYFGGEPDSLSSTTRTRLAKSGLVDELPDHCGQYLHHYPICIRRILPDDTLISPASGDAEPCYSLSFISYARPEQRAGYFLFASFLARSTAALFSARPHWGKVCPLDRQTIGSLYPHMETFRSVCDEFDPEGRFRNDWLDGLIARTSHR